MADGTHPEFGVAWAADGETRPRFYRTPLAWAVGVGDGALLVRSGQDDEADLWILMTDWHAWVAQTMATPVIVSVVDPLFEHSDGEGEGDT